MKIVGFIEMIKTQQHCEMLIACFVVGYLSYGAATFPKLKGSSFLVLWNPQKGLNLSSIHHPLLHCVNLRFFDLNTMLILLFELLKVYLLTEHILSIILLSDSCLLIGCISRMLQNGGDRVSAKYV